MSWKKSVRESVHAKYKGACAYCGCEITLKTMQIDHIIPKVNGGTNDFENLNPSFRVCNNWKSFHDVELFRREIAAQVERLYLRSSNYRIARKYGLIAETGKDVSFYFERHKN